MYILLHKLRRKYISFLPQSDIYKKCLYLEKYFTKRECEMIIRIGKKKPLGEAKLGSGQRVHHATRASHVSWIDCTKENTWIIKKVENALRYCNKQAYNFSLIGFAGKLQFTEYGVNDHFAWHQDIGNKFSSTRKLSFVVQLTDSQTYKGGDLEFAGTQKNCVLRGQGTIIIFPSFQLHRVAPITSGTRHALVGWMHGPHFK